MQTFIYWSIFTPFYPLLLLFKLLLFYQIHIHYRHTQTSVRARTLLGQRVRETNCYQFTTSTLWGCFRVCVPDGKQSLVYPKYIYAEQNIESKIPIYLEHLIFFITVLTIQYIIYFFNKYWLISCMRLFFFCQPLLSLRRHTTLFT